MKVPIKALLSFKLFIKKHIKLRLTKRCAKWINFHMLVRDHVKGTMKPEMLALQPSKVVWMCPQTMTSPDSSECQSKLYTFVLLGIADE